MELDRVTLTGADDSIDPCELVSISKEFPFVEWGILVSRSHSFDGSYRFPSVQWVKDLMEEVENVNLGTRFGPRLQFSCHLCGSWVRDIFNDRMTLKEEWPWLLPNMGGIFQRVQLNFHAEKGYEVPKYASSLGETIGNCGVRNKQIIFQIDGVNDFLFHHAVNVGADAVPLFDMSGGAGIVPKQWPRPFSSSGYHGFAGGLGPDNLGAELDRIEKAAGNRRTWIDMETLIRSKGDAQFDLDKCLDVLNLTKGWLHAPGNDARGIPCIVG